MELEVSHERASQPGPVAALNRTSALVIDGDGAAQSLLAAYLRAMDWDVRTASDGAAGLALLGERPSAVVFAEWGAPGTAGLAVCTRIRQRVWAERPYVIVTTGREPGDLWRALAAGADDVLRKPFERRAVETRVAVARFITEGSARLSLAEAVAEAMAAPAGELVLRQGPVLARIMFRAGNIVWIAVSPAQRRFAVHLAAELGLEEEQIREVLEESKASGVPFDRLLVEWKLTGVDALRECLRSWLMQKLALVRGLASPSVMFVPHAPGGLMFEGFPVGDIAPWLLSSSEPHRSSSPPSLRPDSLASRASMAMRIDGARAAFLLAVRDGTCVAQKGDRSHIEIAWALARALFVTPREASHGSDALLSSPRYHYLARQLDQDPELVLAVVVDMAAATSGSARMQLARVTAGGWSSS